MQDEAKVLAAQRKLESLVGLIRGSGAIQSPEGVRALCQRAGIGNRASAAIEAQSPARLELYRQLLLARVVRALAAAMPLTAAWYGERFELAAKHFAANHQVDAAFLRALSEPFLASVERQWCEDPAVGPGGWELARYEAARVEVASALPGWPAHQKPANGPGSFSLCCAARLMVFDNPVHHWYEKERKVAARSVGKYWILLYRGEDFSIRCLELSELAFGLIVQLTQVGSSFAQALKVACLQTGAAPTEALLDEIAALVEDLMLRQVLAWNDPACELKGGPY